MLSVADLFCGVGGFSCGARAAGARIVFSAEHDARIAACHDANFPEAPPARVETLGEKSPEDMARRLRRLRRETCAPLHLHGSPPCQSLSRANCVTQDPTRGLRLVEWFLDVVEALRPQTWSMEQVNHRALRDLLERRGIPFLVARAECHGVPQSRRRVVAGSEPVVRALEAHQVRSSTLPPARVPADVFSDLRPTSRYRLCSGLDNNTVRGKGGAYLGSRPMRPGECSRSLLEPAHTVWRKPGKIYDAQRGETLRTFTEHEMAELQGFPRDFSFDPGSKTRTRLMVANAVPPPLAEAVVRDAMREAMRQMRGTPKKSDPPS